MLFPLLLFDYLWEFCTVKRTFGMWNSCYVVGYVLAIFDLPTKGKPGEKVKANKFSPIFLLFFFYSKIIWFLYFYFCLFFLPDDSFVHVFVWWWSRDWWDVVWILSCCSFFFSAACCVCLLTLQFIV